MSRRRSGDGGVLATLFLYEIKRLLRDTRMILIAVVAPLVLFPFIIFVMRSVERSEQRRLVETVYEYAVVGDEAEWGRAIVAAALYFDNKIQPLVYVCRISRPKDGCRLLLFHDGRPLNFTAWNQLVPVVYRAVQVSSALSKV